MATDKLSISDPKELLLHNLEADRIVAHFQPIVSVRKKTIVGYEGLCRGQDPVTGALISPLRLFAIAKRENLILELDRHCRSVVLKAFAEAFAHDAGLFLSLNIEPSILEAVAGSNHLLNAVQDAGLRPCNVSVEIVESRVGNLEVLHKFTKRYKEYGFLISLDDVGAGHSNLGRIPLLKPDIIKVDRGLITSLDQEFYKQETVKSLIRLSHRLGALVIAEGIESEAETQCLLELGADMLQGYYFSMPGAARDIDHKQTISRIEATSARFRQHFTGKINSGRQQSRILKSLTQAIINDLSALESGNFDTCLAETVAIVPELECLYVLDDSGIQVSETVCKYCFLSESRRIVFQPASRGADHSLKDYFMPIGPEMPYFVTEPYISFATGNLCRTISSTFQDARGRHHVICLDILVPSESNAACD